MQTVSSAFAPRLNSSLWPNLSHSVVLLIFLQLCTALHMR